MNDAYITFDDDQTCNRYNQGCICNINNHITTYKNNETGVILISKNSLKRYFELDTLDLEIPTIQNGDDELIEIEILNNVLNSTTIFTKSKARRKLLQDTLNLMSLCE